MTAFIFFSRHHIPPCRLVCQHIRQDCWWQVCVLPSPCLARNVDPVIPAHDTFLKPRGGAVCCCWKGGRRRLNIHRSWDSTTMPAKNRATDILSDWDSWQLDAAAAKGVSRLCVNFALSTAQSWSSHQIQTTHLLQRIAPEELLSHMDFLFPAYVALCSSDTSFSPSGERGGESFR